MKEIIFKQCELILKAANEERDELMATQQQTSIIDDIMRVIEKNIQRIKIIF